MAYYPDLSPYIYTRDSPPGLINIGWLDMAKPYQRGSIESDITRKIGQLCLYPENLCRGYHGCCSQFPVMEDYLEDGVLRPLGNGEIHVSAGGIYWKYSAPTLIYHYIAKHGYQPPQEFLDAVRLLIE